MVGIFGGLIAHRSSGLATYSLTTGGSGSIPTRYRGYDNSAYSGTAIGSISPTTFTLNGGTTFNALLFDEGNAQYVFQVAGGTNSGWTTLSVDGTFSLSRTSATYVLSGGKSFWTWTTLDTMLTQPFGAASSNHTVTFT